MIKHQNIKDLSPFLEGLNALKIFTDEQLELVHISMQEDEKIAEHSNDVDVLFYVLSGKGRLTVEEEEAYLEKGSFVEIKKDLKRSWKNLGIIPFCLLAIKKMSNN
jgi:quercetin dioxygenase-like cupin family protein